MSTTFAKRPGAALYSVMVRRKSSNLPRKVASRTDINTAHLRGEDTAGL